MQSISRKLDALTKPEQTSPTARLAFPSAAAHDHRRTGATWRHQPGTEPHLIAEALGHTDPCMAARACSHVPVEPLARMLLERVGSYSALQQTPACRASYNTSDRSAR